MVQLPETIQNAQYSNICEICEERIRRAGKKIKEENPLTTTNLDIGFRVFKIDSSNMEDVYYRPADYNQGQMELFADNIKPDRTPEDLLFQVMLDLGILLSSDIQETEIAGKKVFSVADGYLIAHCSFFPEKRIPISEISAVEVTVMPVSSYALSLDRLIIYKGDTQWLLVSPVNKQDFVKLLKKHNSDIRIKEPVI